MRAEVLVRGVKPDQAWAWWTDYREGPGDHTWAAWAHPGREVERLGEGRLRLQESARVWFYEYHEDIELRLEKPRIRFDARNNAGRFRGSFRFLPGEGGTRIEVVWDQRLVCWLRWLGPLGRFVVRWFYTWDLKHHARDLEREAQAPSASGQGTEGDRGGDVPRASTSSTSMNTSTSSTSTSEEGVAPRPENS